MRATQVVFVAALRNRCYWMNPTVVLRNVVEEFVALRSTARTSCITLSF